MNEVARIRSYNDVQYLVWYCVGCECSHMVPVTGDKKWGFNGDLVKPTLTPSVLCNHMVHGVDGVCHLFMKNGVIEFLGDCTHKFANQTVPLEVAE